MGPLLIPVDVPPTYDSSHPLEPSSWLTSQTQSTGAADEDPIKLPIAGGKGMWNWLQPYSVPTTVETKTQVTDPKTAITTTKTTTTTVYNTEYNALSVGNEDGRLRLEPAPYTLVEGYLQLARPLVQPVLSGDSQGGSGQAGGSGGGTK